MSNENNSEVGNIVGRVKWFNNQRGFGFISYTEDNEEKDIFVHHSVIKTQNQESFKTLRPGEYISFSKSSCPDSSKGHKEQAVCVTGVNGGPLLVDVQQTIKSTRRPRENNSNAPGSESQ